MGAPSFRAYFRAPLESVVEDGLTVTRPEFHTWLLAQQGEKGYALAIKGAECIVLVGAGMGVLRQLELRFGYSMLTEVEAKALLPTCDFGGPTPEKIALGVTFDRAQTQVLVNPVGG